MSDMLNDTGPQPSQEYLQLITQHQGLIYSHIRKIVLQTASAQDVLQETNLVLWRKFDRFEMGSNFAAFACKVAYFKALEFLRKKKQTEFLSFDSDLVETLGVPEEDALPVCDHERALSHCLEKLGPEEITLVNERYYERKAIREMSEELQRSEGSLQQFFFRVRKSLKICIENRLLEFKA